MSELLATQAAQAIQKKPIKDMSLKELLNEESLKEQIARALPKLLSAERFMRVAITALAKTTKLTKCTQASFVNCLLTCAQFGLEPDGRHAHLIPYENKKAGTVECTLIMDYKGLALLVMRAGGVSNLHTDIVCENDEFDYNCGQITKHRINFRQPRGDAYAVYCVCRFKDGTEKHEVMSIEDVNKIRARSKSGNSGPWVTDFNEMAKKTVFRRLTKWVPISPEVQDALEKDDDKLELDGQHKEFSVTNFSSTNKSAEEQLMEVMSSRDEIVVDSHTGEVL